MSDENKINEEPQQQQQKTSRNPAISPESNSSYLIFIQIFTSKTLTQLSLKHLTQFKLFRISSQPT